MPNKLLYIVPTLPVLTCTFIYREIFDLRALGFEVATVSMNTPPADQVSEEAKELLDTTIYLDQVSAIHKLSASVKALFTHPVPMARCLKTFFTATPMQSFRDYQRLGYHLIEACYLAFRIDNDKPDHMHSHFVTRATSINMFLSELTKVPFSFTMHASAIWIDPIALRSKLQRCSFCVSISDYNKKYVVSRYGEEWKSKINVVHCGIEPTTFAGLSQRALGNEVPRKVLAVGQLAKRKGYHVLIEAARILRDRQVEVSWTVVGDGEERSVLESLIGKHNLHSLVKLVGAKPHEEVPKYLAECDIFSLPCIIGDDNTRDGIPVALMEAMSFGLPVVSTNIVGLPELIDSGQNGILVEPDNAHALADAIERLANSAELRQQIGKCAVEKIHREFNSEHSAGQLANLFDPRG